MTRRYGSVVRGASAAPPGESQDAAVGARSTPRARHSVLFPPDAIASHLHTHEPAFFRDLNLDQVVSALTRGREAYELAPLLYTLPRTVETVEYRQAALRDLERAEAVVAVQAFAEAMRTVRAHLRQAGKLHYRWQKRPWFLEAVWTYAEGAATLAGAFGDLDLRSDAFRGLRDHLAAYCASEPFTALLDESRRLRDELAAIQYTLLVRENRVRVDRFAGGDDYGAEVADTFRRFEQGDARPYKFDFPSSPDMNHVEAGILDLVARLWPDTFAFLDRFASEHCDFLDPTLERFDREVQVYLAWIEYTASMRRAGLPFCYPEVRRRPEAIHARHAFDVALAAMLAERDGRVVTNDVELHDPERAIVVTGPNQGGKTTFARMFGQLHYLGRMGLTVPGREARLEFFDGLHTHFEREENLGDLASKFEEDVSRIHETIGRLTADSLVIMNETFSSTTVQDALLLSRDILGRILQAGARCVFVTFLDELASGGPEVVSMVGTVDPDDPAIRTFRVVRQPASGRAYAEAIARKHGLTPQRLRERLADDGGDARR
jgi:DNA mismatch repair protein MutS